MEGKELTTQQSSKFEIGPGGGLLPQSFEALYRMANIMSESGLMPKGMESPEAVFVAVQMGMEVGMSPMQAVQNIAPINGRPSIYGDSVLGLVRSSGLLEYITETIEGEGDQMLARVIAKRKNEPEPIERVFTVRDAKTAGLWGKQGPWSQYPKRMLQMRARSWALRDGFGDVIKGLQIAGHSEPAIDLKPDGDQYVAAESEEPGPVRPVVSDDKVNELLAKDRDDMDHNEKLVSSMLRKDPKFLRYEIETDKRYLLTVKKENLDLYQMVVDHWNYFFPGDRFPLDEKPTDAPIEDVPGPEPDGQESSGSKHDDFRDQWIKLKKSGYIKFVHDNLKSFEACKEQDFALYQEAMIKWAGFYPNQPWPLLPQDETDEKRNNLREAANSIPDKENPPEQTQDQFNGDYSEAKPSMEDEQTAARHTLKQWRAKEPDLFTDVAGWLGYDEPMTINIDLLDVDACYGMTARIVEAFQRREKDRQGPPA